jgi:flagellar biosynthesis component FlhA
MKTKKALGALLGLLGSLPAFPFLPLAGFSAPLLFTANLQADPQQKKRSKRRRNNASKSNVYR